MKQNIILAVDDERANLFVMEEILDEFEVITASSADQVYTILEQSLPDAILLDIMMPGIDGMTLAGQLKNDHRFNGIPVIFVSAVTDPKYVAEGLGLGAEDFIRKPFNGTELLARVKRVLDSSRKRHELYFKATRDALTGLFNREYFNEQIDAIIRKWRREKNLFSLGIIDIDHFKNVNDTYGHQAGDTVLRSLAHMLSGSLRGTDLVARYGGEEFVFILANTDRYNSGAVIDRLRVTVSEMEMDRENHLVITFSCGISDITEAGESDDIFKKIVEIADRRLYAAKNGGRNRVVTEE